MAALIELVTLLIETALTFQHSIVAIGGRVIEVIVAPVIFDDVGVSRPVERARHGHAPVALRDFRMACLAAFGGSVG